jgi:hypothetical protein
VFPEIRPQRSKKKFNPVPFVLFAHVSFLSASVNYASDENYGVESMSSNLASTRQHLKYKSENHHWKQLWGLINIMQNS